MLPLSAFSTKSCPTAYAIDSVGAGQLAQLCVQLKDEKGCPIDVLEKTQVQPCPPGALPVDIDAGGPDDIGGTSSESSSSGSGDEDLPEGWRALYRVRYMQFSQVLRAYVMSVVDAGSGVFSVTIPPEDLKDPGVMLAEVAIQDDQQRDRLIDRRYLKIMPTLATANVRPIMPSDVRLALWDYCPGANTLLDDYEFPEDLIIHMIRRPLDLWNELPPDICRASPENFPWREHWLRCVCGYLLVAASRLHRRNDLTYNAAGMSIKDNASWPHYRDEGEKLIAEFKEWARHKKIELNIQRGYGAVFSPYM